MLRKSYCNMISSSLTDRRVCPISAAPDTQPSVTSIDPVSIVNSLVGSFVDLSALFRTNVDIKGQVFEIDEAPLVAEFFRAARRLGGLGLPAGTEFYYPKMFAPYNKMSRGYKILGYLDNLQVLRNTAGKMLADLEQNTQDLDKAETSIKNLELSKQQIIAGISDKGTKIGIILQAH